VNRRSNIGAVPENISTFISKLPSVPEDSIQKGDRDVRHQNFIKYLRRKFFPIKPPPGYFEKIFDLVANTCSTPTCKMDKVIELLDSASNLARRADSDHDHLSKPLTSLKLSGRDAATLGRMD